jgi:tRNA wybutosine-synthesizing protein 3
MKKNEFLAAKDNALKLLEKACNEKTVDERIVPLLNLLNTFPGCYTSSSCSGRIVILELPKIGDKQRARFLGKWHTPIEVSDIISTLQTACKGYIWFLTQSPILHIISDSIEMVDTLLKSAIGSGFKNSGVKSIGRKIVLEVCSTERLDTPIGKDGLLYYKEEYLSLLVHISNAILQKSTDKLARFENKLKEIND